MREIASKRRPAPEKVGKIGEKVSNFAEKVGYFAEKVIIFSLNMCGLRLSRAWTSSASGRLPQPGPTL